MSLLCIFAAACQVPGKGMAHRHTNEKPALVVPAVLQAIPSSQSETVGAFIGQTLASEVRVPEPVIDDGISGLLQAIPKIAWRSSEDIEAAWRLAGNMRDPHRQNKVIRREAFHANACKDLVDLRTFFLRAAIPFRWRDTYRDRTWADPAVAALLAEAYREFRLFNPGSSLTVGDVAQAGCGALNHDSVIRWIIDRPWDAAASRFLNRAKTSAFGPMVIEERRAADYPSETHRFASPDTRLRVEQQIMGWDAPKAEDSALRLRVSTRRYTSGSIPTRKDMKRAKQKAASAVKRGVLVHSEKRTIWDEEHGSEQIWMQRWIWPKGKRQLVTVSTKKLKRKFNLRWMHEFRISRWNPKKPESFRREMVWQAKRRPSKKNRSRRWRRWDSVYEAGHITHTGGLDVDVSFATRTNRGHFAVNVGGIDAERTWEWFQALSNAAENLGLELDKILVDRKVRWWLRRYMPENDVDSELWEEIVRLAPGHDAHHHIRIRPPTLEARQQASKKLESYLGESTRTAQATRLSKDRAAFVPEAATASSPTPSR